jgi:peptide/nickel transport system substrate-binding protein
MLFAVMALHGCAREPRAPNTLRISGPEPSTLDPAKAYDTTSINFVRVLYRGLVDYGKGAEIVPAVAQKYSISPDGRTYSFKLRPDVHFHSGRRVVAEDFRFALERVLDPATASDGLSFYQAIEGAEEFGKAKEAEAKKPAAQRQTLHVRGIEVRGEDEIVFHLTKPDVTFMNVLTMPFAYAVPREAVAKGDDYFKSNPDGCGPFMLEDWRHDAWLRLKKNPRYYDPNLPKAERIDMSIGGDDTLQLMRFELGDIDVMSLTDTNPPDFLRLKRDPQWKNQIEHAPMMDVRYVCMNTEKAPFNNVLVRRAVSHAINRQSIAAFRAGRATLARGPLPPGMPAYNPQQLQYSYDPQKAKMLLKQAGYPKGFKVDFWFATTEEWYGKAAQSIQQDLKQIGITVNPKKVTYAELRTKAGKRGNIQLSMMGWLQDFPDPSNFLVPLFSEESITPVSSLNRAFYSNPQVNRLLNAAQIELNKAKRLEMYRQAEKLIVQDAPLVFLHHTERYVVHQPWVRGYRLHPMWSARYEYVSVQK